jgi:hypothetical protein
LGGCEIAFESGKQASVTTIDQNANSASSSDVHPIRSSNRSLCATSGGLKANVGRRRARDDNKMEALRHLKGAKRVSDVIKARLCVVWREPTCGGVVPGKSGW